MVWLRRILLVSVLLVLLTVAGGWLWLLGRAPQREGERVLTGLQKPVDVQFDVWGIPHLTASNEADAMRALGYLHAQERLWQMDLMRRVAQGRLAELVGEAGLKTDKLFRTLGIRAAATRQAEALIRQGGPVREAAQAYVAGINQYIREQRLPVEYALTRSKPAPFTVVDSLSIAGLMAYGFSQGFQEDPMVSQLSARLGPAYMKELVYDWPGAQTTPVTKPPLKPSAASPAVRPDPVTAPEPQPAASVSVAMARLVTEINQSLPVPQLQGSNSWLIAGKLSASGKPLFANDPHIGFHAPAVWYEAQIHTPDWQVYGHFLPGIPFPLLGHNGHHAVGLTMWENDEVDYYQLAQDPAVPGRVKERGRWVQLGGRVETIVVRDAAPVTLHVQLALHGPVVNSLFLAMKDSPPVAVNWTYLDPRNRPFDSLYAISHATDLKSMEQAASQHWSPGLNLSYADEDGNIAMWAIGRQTLRPLGVNSHQVLDGSSGKQEPLGFAPFAQNPRYVNPPSGIIYSANHPYPAALSAGGITVAGYYPAMDRALRLSQLLAPREAAWTLQDLQRIQTDVRNPVAASLCQSWTHQLDGTRLPPTEQQLLGLIGRWQGDYPVNSLAATVCDRWKGELVNSLFADKLSAEDLLVWRRLFLLDKSLYGISRNPQSPWWDHLRTPAVETRDQQLQHSWKRTVAGLTAQLGPDIQQWRWGKVHTLTHEHGLGKVPALAPFFNVGPFPVAGARDTIDNQYTRMETGGAPVVSGPSTRRLIDMAEPEAAVGINPIGQSGILLDEHHHDQAALFATQQYRPMWISSRDVEAHQASQLRLLP
ncbi:penicillin acylase family protein [Leeia sp.]|uniref:penicillin acylase family protein n=1 Tax=Leeia sp. TaxID=2884678 RepID=UPI0035AF612B